jgi:hypothetical protein
MAQPENTSIVIGFAALIMGSMISPIAADLWRKMKGSEYATRRECKEKHDLMEKDCQSCKAATHNTICAIQHDASKNRKLLLLIAIKLQVPTDELKEYM